ncbi:MAG: amidohydrolase family protein [Clostridia bacterium]|nr:amidohydrolase family protein [Clostridia bacterium]
MRSKYYFNVNGCYGKGPYAQPDYPELSDLMASMDRLGVWQTIVSHNCARDLHPVYGNRYLIEDMKKHPEYADRLVPAFSANPSMLVGNGELEHLESCFEAYPTAALVLSPVTNRFRFLEINPILKRIKKYRPVVLVDVSEMNLSVDLEDLIASANAFPELNFVIRKVMWWQLSICFNALNRTKNVYLDISWLHTRDAIKIVAEHVGPERLVFGLGSKAHNGAALAGLAYARIPQEQRDCIAWDNLVNLFPKKRQALLKTNRKELPFAVENRFWEPFMAGEGVKDVLVIDAHTHIGPFTRSWFLTENELDKQIALFEEDMERFGIDMVCSMSEVALFGEPIQGNIALEEAIGNRTDRFRGNLVINPHYAELYTEELLDKFFKGGYFCGFKLIPEYIGVDITDPCLDHIFRYADRYHLHVLVHSWEGKHGTALQVAETATRYPNATFIIAHMGGGSEGRRQSEAIAQDERYKNCMFELCGTFTTDIPLEETLQKIDYRRVIFGTDTVVHDVAWEMGRILSLNLPDEWLEEMLGANMKRVLDREQFPQ